MREDGGSTETVDQLLIHREPDVSRFDRQRCRSPAIYPVDIIELPNTGIVSPYSFSDAGFLDVLEKIC